MHTAINADTTNLRSELQISAKYRKSIILSVTHQWHTKYERISGNHGLRV